MRRALDIRDVMCSSNERAGSVMSARSTFYNQHLKYDSCVRKAVQEAVRTHVVWRSLIVLAHLCFFFFHHLRGVCAGVSTMTSRAQRRTQ
jgi:hypothetical protein